MPEETRNAREWVLVPREPTQAMREAFNDWRPTEGNNYAGAQSFSAQERWAFRQRYAALLAAAPQQPAAGEEIMVNAAHGVFTLPLQPSGLSSGPRFVVHVPAPEQPAAPTLAKHQPCGCVICTCEDDYRCHGCGAKHCGNHTDHPPYVVQQPAAEEQLTYKGVPIGPMQTFADMERQVIAPVGAAEDMVLDAIERRESSAPVGVGLSALRVQEWLQREYDILPPVQEIEQAMRTPCSCPDTERALAQPPEARGGGEVVAWMTPGGDVSRSFYWCLERCLPGQEEPQPLYAAPPSAPVGVEAFESRLRGRAGPFTAQPGERYVDADIALAVLREALAQQPAPSAPDRPKVGLVRAGDGTYYAFEKGQSEQPAAVDEARGVVDVYTMQTIADAAAALDKRGDRQMAARLIRLHTRLLAALTEARNVR